MTLIDRELLEKSAKAAGIELKPMQINNVTEQGDDRFIGYMTNPQEWSRGWFDPLKDDGDALRLAVELKLEISFESEPYEPIVCVDASWVDIPYMIEYLREDPYAATRRAIVRAAAEIGKGM